MSSDKEILALEDKQARVPQCLDKNAEGLEIHRVAVDAATRHLAMGEATITLLARADEVIE